MFLRALRRLATRWRAFLEELMWNGSPLFDVYSLPHRRSGLRRAHALYLGIVLVCGHTVCGACVVASARQGLHDRLKSTSQAIEANDTEPRLARGKQTKTNKGYVHCSLGSRSHPARGSFSFRRRPVFHQSTHRLQQLFGATPTCDTYSSPAAWKPSATLTFGWLVLRLANCSLPQPPIGLA